jgi:hypothetical protein
MPGHQEFANLFEAKAVHTNQVPDPKDGGDISPHIDDAVVRLTWLAGSETRTLKDPTTDGQTLMIYMITAGGTITVTADSAYDESGATALTFDAVGEYVTLVGFVDAPRSVSGGVITDETYAWRVTAYDGTGGPSLSLDSITVSGVSDLAGGTQTAMIAIADASTYAVLAADSGKVHILPDLSQDIIISLPTAASGSLVAGLFYEFWYSGVLADASDWQINTGSNTNFFLGGVVELDMSAGSVVHDAGDGNSNSRMAILTPGVGTLIKMYCDGTTWTVNGTVQSDTGNSVTWNDQ